ncbi:NUDIX hydrolase [Sporosarcina koreensis]|uniref:NUDIX hydrolase n=1 Tax=Bacillales TaxID=1385 RepID=UPI000AE824B5|nr:NUDIX domain-containing protein [Sporosarcina koreensis]
MHPRNRGSAVVIEDDKVAVIKRCREGEEYYVFPGGGIEDGETPEHATIREAFEELGVQIEVIECLGIVEFNGEQHYFIAKIVGGEFGTGQGEEYDEIRSHGLYEPIWIQIAALDSLDVRPMRIAKKLMERM